MTKSRSSIAKEEKYNKTVIIASNDVNLLYEITDNIIVLKKGHVLIKGETTSIYQDIDILDCNMSGDGDISTFIIFVSKEGAEQAIHEVGEELIKKYYFSI